MRNGTHILKNRTRGTHFDVICTAISLRVALQCPQVLFDTSVTKRPHKFRICCIHSIHSIHTSMPPRSLRLWSMSANACEPQVQGAHIGIRRHHQRRRLKDWLDDLLQLIDTSSTTALPRSDVDEISDLVVGAQAQVVSQQSVRPIGPYRNLQNLTEFRLCHPKLSLFCGLFSECSYNGPTSPEVSNLRSFR